MACPHEEIRFCPLYIAAHGTKSNAKSCLDFMKAECTVRNQDDYAKLIAALAKTEPEIVRERANAENLHYSKQQRQRNLRLLGMN